MNNLVCKPARGFTLIELMIVVSIIAIIAAFAYPTYTESVAKSRRADAQSALTGLASAMERFYTTNSTYVGAGQEGSGSSGAPIAGLYPSQAPLDGSNKFYNLTLAASATAYTVTATPTGGQTGDRCGAFSLTSTGVKNASETDCWR